MRTRSKKDAESDLDRRLFIAVSSLPQTKTKYEVSNFVPLLEEHQSLLKECQAKHQFIRNEQYEACRKLFLHDACIFKIWMEKGSNQSELLLKNFCRKISGVAIQLRKITPELDHSDITPAFHKLALLASTLFHDRTHFVSNKDFKILLQVVAGFYEKADQPELGDTAPSGSPELGDTAPSGPPELGDTAPSGPPELEMEIDLSKELDHADDESTLLNAMPQLDNENPSSNVATKNVSNVPNNGLQKEHDDVKGIAHEPTIEPTPSNARKNVAKVTWRHIRRLTTDDNLCFVCKSDDTSNGPLERCGAILPIKCSTQFHIGCLQNYDGGSFSAEYMKMLMGHYQCPLHHCDMCWQGRYKTSAVHIKSFMIECKQCFRAYHEECLPSGLKVVEDGKLRKTTCHSHSTHKETGRRLPFCSDCETRDVGLSKCSKCIRSFHLACRTFCNVKGDEYDTLCGSCFYGESMKAGQPVIVRSGTGLYSGIAVDISKYPVHSVSQDKFGKYLGEPGYVPVEWSGCQNLFNLLPATRVLAMFTNSHAVCKAHHKDKDFDEEWKLLESTLQPVRPNFTIISDVKQQIKASVYHHSTLPPTLREYPVDEYLCNCPDGDADRCGPKSTCSARMFQHECPKACESGDRMCHNRSLTKKLVHPNIEKKEAAGKGYGVFATNIIKKGEHIAEYAGELISNEEQKRRNTLSALAQNDEEMHYIMILDGSRAIDCKYKGNIARYINHSCDPNCMVETVDIDLSKSVETVKYDKRVRIIALRDIPMSEELSFSYNMVQMSEDCVLPECRCNAPNCKGTLGRAVAKNKERLVSSQTKKTGVSAKPGVTTKRRGRKQVEPEPEYASSDSQDDLKLIELKEIIKREVTEVNNDIKMENVLTHVERENSSVHESNGVVDASDIHSACEPEVAEETGSASINTDNRPNPAIPKLLDPYMNQLSANVDTVFIEVNPDNVPAAGVNENGIAVNPATVMKQLCTKRKDIKQEVASEVGSVAIKRKNVPKPALPELLDRFSVKVEPVDTEVNEDNVIAAVVNTSVIAFNPSTVMTPLRTTRSRNVRADFFSPIKENEAENTNVDVKHHRKRGRPIKTELIAIDDIKVDVQSTRSEIGSSSVGGSENALRRSSRAAAKPPMRYNF